MKGAVTKVIDTLTQEDIPGTFQKLFERYNRCIAAGGGYLEEDLSFMCVLSIKVPMRKKVWKLHLVYRLYDMQTHFIGNMGLSSFFSHS